MQVNYKLHIKGKILISPGTERYPQIKANDIILNSKAIMTLRNT